MEENTNNKADSANTAAQENPNNHSNPSTQNDNPRRTPFTALSQVDADHALARTLQEQERAYMMLTMGGNGGSSYGSWESYEHEDDFDGDYDDGASEEDDNASYVEVDDGEADEFDAHAHAEGEEDDGQNVELDPSAFPDDEAFARALQDAEDRNATARLLAQLEINESEGEGEGESEDEDEEDHGDNSQDRWEDVDPDELSYEELLALSEIIGTESRGLSAETIASLPSINHKLQGNQEGISDSCVICMLDFEDDDTLILLSCKHSYHSECINNWLQINKVCPVCNSEVSSPNSNEKLTVDTMNGKEDILQEDGSK